MDKIVVFIFGAIIGSFLNVCIYRLPKNQSIILPPSHCPNCKRNILWYDNIPILSYLILSSRCRFCGAKIPFRYFLVEVLTASLILATFMGFGMTAKSFAYSVLVCGLVIATFVDFEMSEIPDQVSIGGLILGLVLSYIIPSTFNQGVRWHALLDSFIGAVAGGAAIYMMGFLGELAFKKEAMGGGDVKFMAMIGSFLGLKLTMLTFFAAPIFGGIVGILLKLKDGREVIPYGPYISLAALVAIFFGDNILRTLFYGLY